MSSDITKKRKAVYNDKVNKTTQRYVKEHYDSFIIRMPKGKKDKVKAFAESKGESLNGFVNRVIDKEMESDVQKNF